MNSFLHVFHALEERQPRNLRTYPSVPQADDSPTSAVTAHESQQAQRQKDVPTADPGTAGVGILYPVTCRARYYDAASRILEEEGQLFTHDNTNELGALIEQWINDARDNWEPR